MWVRETVLLLIPLFVLCNEAIADGNDQANMQFVPKAPTAAAFAKYIDYPVSYYTGVPSINIPLYEISFGGLSIPISLSYHASGITASQEATRVGLGWSLNAGGAITRTVKCKDDFDLVHGYFAIRQEWDKTSVDPNYFSVDSSGRTLIGDSEPDIFYYSFPGESGKAVFTKDSIMEQL